MFHRMDYVPVHAATNPLLFDLSTAGAFGVPVFFLLSAFLIFCSTGIVHQDVQSTPLSLNAINDAFDTTGRSDIRLYKESGRLALSRLRTRGGGDQGAAQFKTA
jgi:hypothetical protein